MKQFFSFFAVLFCLSVQAQLPILNKEDFNAPNPEWYWSDVDDQNNYRKARNGVLYHEQRAENVFWTLRNAHINTTKDFQLDVKFKPVEAMQRGMYYIIMKGSDDFYLYFGINTENKTYWIGGEQKGNWQTYNITSTEVPEPKSDAIISGLKDNILSLRATNGVLSFRINDKEVEKKNFKETFPLLHAHIYYYGVATSAPMKTETDYVYLWQDIGLNLLTTERFNLKKKHLSSAINTQHVEKWPVISPDGKTLYFVRSGDPQSTAGAESDEVWYSTAINDTTWSQAKSMPKPINNNGHNTVMSVTPDNNTLFLMHTYNADGSSGPAGFSTSTRTVDGWSLPKTVAMDNYYNRAPTNEFFLSNDRKVMILAVKRDDTLGENDLYVSWLKEDGHFSEPKNMGSVLNTSAEEGTAFLASDDRTLYFSSEGHPGYGSSDVFMSRRLDDTWLNWSKPQNLGPEINSSNWEAYYTIPASGAHAYMIMQNGDNKADLYRIDLPPVFRPDPVVIVSGKVINTKTQKPVSAEVLYSYLMKSEKPGHATANPGDGSYKIALPSGNVYAFLAQKEGFYAISENLDLTKLKGYEEVTKDLYVTPIEVGQTIRLNNIFFDFDKATLKETSYPELDRVVELLNTHPGIVIEVGGHTDNVGQDAYNLKLSQLRSEAVMKYLLTKKITASRVSNKGYGESKPVSDNESDAGRSTNRRVEFTILKQ